MVTHKHISRLKEQWYLQFIQFYSYEMILKTLKLLNSDENGGKAIFRVLTWTNSEIQGFQGHLLSFQGFQGPVDTLV